jgi:D-3-phosphoglycerate dehydrogenase
VGVDNIDVERATQKGVLVVNSPEGNTIAAAELTVALLLSLSRNIAQAAASLRNGEWKRSKYVGVEVYGKTVGVIGLGKIGREVAKRLLGMEMNVLAYDPFLSEEQAPILGCARWTWTRSIARPTTSPSQFPNQGTGHDRARTDRAD